MLILASMNDTSIIILLLHSLNKTCLVSDLQGAALAPSLRAPKDL